MSVTFSPDITNLDQKKVVKYFDRDRVTEPYIWLKPGETSEYGGITYVGDANLSKLAFDVYLNEEQLNQFPPEVQALIRPYGFESAEVESMPEINMANANARLILALLGYDDEDLVGSDDPSRFLAKCRQAMNSDMSQYTRAPEDSWQAQGPVDTDDSDITMDNGIPIKSTGHARVLSHGIDENYLTINLHKLADIALWCINKENQINEMPDGVIPLRKKDVQISWG